MQILCVVSQKSFSFWGLRPPRSPVFFHVPNNPVRSTPLNKIHYNQFDLRHVGVGGVNRIIILNVFRLPQTIADSIHTVIRRDATRPSRVVSGGVNWLLWCSERPLMLPRMSFSSAAAAGDSEPAAIFGGNKSSGRPQRLMETAQMTKPSHHAPIHRGSRWSMSGSGYTQQTAVKFYSFDLLLCIRKGCEV